ncbi:MAG TPA: hypothetical protein VMH36_15075 [Alphaproteobacteria bacterium]|nr:hypothetical protein [Alphaproteobacteria bacterium]
MSKPSLIPILAVTASSLLYGCDSVTVTRSEINPGYTGSFYVQTQAQSGVNSVIVRNSPFPPQTVVDALQSRYQSGQYKFGTGPNPADWNGYTVVLSFGGPTMGGQSLCQNLNTPQAGVPSGRTEVLGEYCYGDRLVTEASGRASAITDPQDPRFQELVGAVVTELFKNDYNIYHKSGGGSVPR